VRPSSTLWTVTVEGEPRWVVLAATENDAMKHAVALLIALRGNEAAARAEIALLRVRRPTAKEADLFDEMDGLLGPAFRGAITAAAIPPLLR
jgi:hypothetical protein